MFGTVFWKYFCYDMIDGLVGIAFKEPKNVF